MNPKNFFTTAQQHLIRDAIASAELNTSGEIRVHIDNKCDGEVLDQAANVFRQLKMDQTQLRNGVLFYLAVGDQKFAILGDQGINEKVPNDFWDNIKDVLQNHFRHQHFTEGICKGIEMAGLQLKNYFPICSDDCNELSNDVSFGK
jgi:uncharacterized membrane protein